MSQASHETDIEWEWTAEDEEAYVRNKREQLEKERHARWMKMEGSSV